MYDAFIFSFIIMNNPKPSKHKDVIFRLGNCVRKELLTVGLLRPILQGE